MSPEMLDRRTHTTLVVPNNDAEAAMILRLNRHLKLPVVISRQPHGARLEKEPHILERIVATRRPRVVVVEIPGPKEEKKIRSVVPEFIWIDHHQYDFLDRARDPKTGKLKPSSLEQFIEYFGITDAELRKWKMNPKLVKGVGVSDRAFIWGLQKEGYSPEEVRQVWQLIGRLERTNVRQPGVPSRSVVLATARAAWKRRVVWNGFSIVRSQAKYGIRGELSALLAVKLGKPTPVILVERQGNRLYVQESPLAGKLFDVLGGFTFGGVDNWGYDNTMFSPERTLQDVKEALVELMKP